MLWFLSKFNKRRDVNMLSRVKWFNNAKGYGFTTDKELGDILIHYSNIKKDGYKTLKENQLIEFEVVKTEKGYQAVNIKPVEEMQTIE